MQLIFSKVAPKAMENQCPEILYLGTFRVMQEENRK
jgi:hypothetical protein